MLDHPTPIHIRSNIMDALATYAERANADGLQPLPVCVGRLVRDAIAKAVAEHAAETKELTP